MYNLCLYKRHTCRLKCRLLLKMQLSNQNSNSKWTPESQKQAPYIGAELPISRTTEAWPTKFMRGHGPAHRGHGYGDLPMAHSPPTKFMRGRSLWEVVGRPTGVMGMEIYPWPTVQSLCLHLVVGLAAQYNIPSCHPVVATHTHTQTCRV